MKILQLIILLLSLNAYSQERGVQNMGQYSDDNYVICDFPTAEIVHFTENQSYAPESLKTEGFIHCARPSQLSYVMGKYFVQDSYVLLISHKDKLGDKLVYEGKNPDNLYPHLYRPLYAEDIIEKIVIERNKHGQFEIPEQLKP